MAIDRGVKQGEPDVEELLEEATHKVERLRALYEQYFMGIEKMEPQTARKEVQRKMHDLAQLNIRNTSMRYRFNMLNQKFSTFQTYWNRTCRAIENGTYFRDVARAGRNAIAKGKDIPDEVLRSLPERMRKKILREREQMAARAGGKKEMGRIEGNPPEPVAQMGFPTGNTADDFDEHADIDAALDNLFGEAEAAVTKPVPPPPVVAKPSIPPPVAAAPPPKPMGTVPPRAATAPAPAKTPVPTVPPRAGTPPPVPMAARPAATPPPVSVPRAATPPPAPSAGNLPPGVDEKTARELHKRFVQAKKLVGENADQIKYEHIVATLAKQAPTIMKQHNAKGVDFEVVIKENKVILKATPKK